MFSPLTKANLGLNVFAFFNVPLVWLCRPKIMVLESQKLEINIPLKRRTKNHLKSMYFGALAIGADLAGGYFALYKADQRKMKISMAFKGVEGRFLKRPEADVLFTCDQGDLIDQVLTRSAESGERVNEPIRIVATCPSINGDEVMAEFDLILSVKVLKS
ncbi:DUF4442 domain-containing protein [Vibrio hannami]|uniref:DUF4442 domain-containing protein n=1 Tax=Vibrio hannami TaxID=2717094 RepID=UPI00240F0697|nr:DUF4442 domain-containing protein [Vibrio hannami]MDG3088083.1 DUF4442 domain-containing protein [Vibrio hannami]